MDTQKLIEVEDKLTELSSENYSYDELGSVNGFQQAEEYKSEFCRWATILLDETQLYSQKINRVVADEAINVIGEHAKNIKTTLDNIKKIVSQGIHQPNFPKQRESFIKSLKNYLEAAQKRLTSYELKLSLCNLEEKLGETDFIEQIKSEAGIELKKASNAAKEAEKLASETQKVLNSAQDKIINKQIEDSSSHFESLHSHHKQYEKYWLIGFVASSVVGILAVLWALSLDVAKEFDFYSAVSFVKRLIVITVPTIFMKLTLDKYNAERNLRIIYAHREKVLDQYNSFEAGIGDDTDAKNNFRIEVARYIFSDPQSNYSTVNSNKMSEININPIMSAAEKFSSKSN